MRSFQIVEFGAPLREVSAEAPAPEGTEVLLRVRGCGVCHSDLHLADGYFDLGGGRRADLGSSIRPPRTLGHEIVGEVVAAGPEAEGVEIGDRRVVYPWIGCGECALCAAGKEQLCRKPQALGVNRDGGYSDHVLVPHPRYLLDFEGIPESVAGTCACSGLTAYAALKKTRPLGPGDALVIVGAGGVGLAAVEMAEAVTGVAPIVADIDPAKREAAAAAGAARTIDPSEPGAVREVLKSTGGVAAAIDFVGAESSARFATDILRNGGRAFIVGLFGGALTFSLPLFPLKEIGVQGSYVGSLADMEELVALLKKGAAPTIPVETRPLDEVERALTDLREGRVVGRIVLTP